MARLLLLLITAAVCTDGGLAISCFSRSGSTDESNRTAISCGDFPYCYSYSKGLERFAGCSSCTGLQEYYSGGCSNTICTLGMDCQVCSSDFCNTVSPSSISCFYRSGVHYSANDNGTKVTCHSGVATCYSYMSGSSSYAGCGDCRTRDDPSCVTCNSAYCNTMASSAISCYAGSTGLPGGPGGSLSNGTAVACPTGVTSCFSYRRLGTSSSTSISFTSGCGACNSTGQPACATCSTDLCNTVTPSAISCNIQTHYDSVVMFSHGNAVACPSGMTSCYSTMASNTYNALYDYGCGSCSADAMPSCVNCATDNCNTADRSGHTCYSLLSNHGYTRAITVACTGGIKSCYTLTKPITFSNNQFETPVSGCGVCTPTSTALYGCISCNTSNCNAPANSGGSSLPATLSTPPSNAPASSSSSLPATLSTPPPGQSNPTANPAITASGIGCYQSFSKNKKTEQQKTSCPSYSSCFDYTSNPART
uniref:TNFR-Cys domain-containing protein n=1 Tax=Macrostomum lignano TaxID=282301 RepID=A0A1I8I4U7_9PLAT